MMLRLFSLMIIGSVAIATSVYGQQLVGPSHNALPGTLSDFHDARSPFAASIDRINVVSHPLVTKRVDLSQTVAKFAAKKQLSSSQARLEAFMFLGLAPPATGSPIADQVQFKKVAKDVFEITASPSYFERLPGMQRCLELGKKMVVIEVQTLAIAPDDTNRVSKLITPGTLKVHYDRIPQVSPVATNDADGIDAFEPYVSASTITRQNIPVTVGELSKQNLAQLNLLIEGSKTAKVLCQPMLSALPGQSATVSDMSYQPFVVGTEPGVEMNGEEFAKPIVQAIEQGTTVRVKAQPVGDKIQLMTDIAISRIMNVDVFRSPDGTLGPATTVQMPNQRIRQVHLASLVQPGATLLIDPNLAEPLEAKKTGLRAKRVPLKLLVTLTARIVQMDAEGDSSAVAVSGRP